MAYFKCFGCGIINSANVNRSEPVLLNNNSDIKDENKEESEGLELEKSHGKEINDER